MTMPKDPERVGWRHAAGRVLDLIYPPVCAICEESLTQGKALCDACRRDLPRLAEPFCQTCGEMFPGKIEGPFVCPNCHDLKFAFEFARPAMVRDARTLDLIHRLKYSRHIHLVGELGRLASESFDDPRLAPALAGSWPLVPVPLHRQRLRLRHFNQAAEIARVLSEQTGMPVLHALRRIRLTDSQTRLTRKQRMANLHGAFAITRHARAWCEGAPAGAVLIDDVLTTGSTVHECAKVLRHAGVGTIYVVTVMRG